MTWSSQSLSDQGHWDALRNLISRGQKLPALDSLLQKLKASNAKFYIVEDFYLDRDYSAEYISFYAKLFKITEKICKRIHFFSKDLADLKNKGPVDIIATLEECSRLGEYLGFTVVRPVTHAPLGRTVIRTHDNPPAATTQQLVSSAFDVHLLGATLEVVGFPFIQQDQRITACAQAAIWATARHFHARHRGQWVSAPEINSAAQNPLDEVLSQSLPSGSGGITVRNMVRALNYIGLRPIVYARKINLTNNTLYWPPTLTPAHIVDRYIDSGLPVILILTPWAKDQESNHAVVASGRVITVRDPATLHHPYATRSELIDCLIVNDDQRGVDVRLPVTKGSTYGETPYNVEHIGGIVIPLPDKVYMKAEQAEAISWGLLEEWRQLYSIIEAELKSRNISKSALDHIAMFKNAADNNEVLARTYLTFGWRYKQRILKNHCSETIKNAIYDQEFPRLVWVTEFGRTNDLNLLDDKKAVIASHIVTDATALPGPFVSQTIHLPGVLQRAIHDRARPSNDYQTETFWVVDDRPYGIKIRGT